MSESWRPVVDWEGLYEVSDQGRVRSLDRISASGTCAGRLYRGRVLSLNALVMGYPVVSLVKGKKHVTKRVSRAVLEAFVGPCPDGMEACHCNGVRTDNRLENLRWDTKSANNLDRVKHGTHHHTRKTHCPHGHALVEPNLDKHRLLKGWRSCRACLLGHAAAQRARRLGLPIPDKIQVAHERYAKIMGRSAA